MFRIGSLVAAGVLLYVVLAYAILPKLWTHHERQPALEGRAFVTKTSQGIPGDALNVGLVGNRDEILKAFERSGWYRADALAVRTSIGIAGSVLLRRKYLQAPVSNLFYDGRRQDLAFERPASLSAKQRHHVRFWQVLNSGAEQRPVWLGSASFDRSVGFSHYTGQITHHIAPDIDVERDDVINDLRRSGTLTQTYQVSGVDPTINGRNGGGDRYYTDGEITFGVIRENAAAADEPPIALPSSVPIGWKTRIWSAIKGILFPQASPSPMQGH